MNPPPFHRKHAGSPDRPAVGLPPSAGRKGGPAVSSSRSPQFPLPLTSLERRFLSRVQSGDGCWSWTGRLDRDGYGRISERNIWHQAHRLSYSLFVGPIPEGQHVLHTCDNPTCINPRHLRLGTHAENMVDRGEKGRAAKGERNGRGKLTRKDVGTIRRLVAGGVAQRQVARLFRIHNTTVRDIIKGRIWAACVAVIALALLTGCYLPPLPDGLRVEVGDGSQPCLSWPDSPEDCFKAEGYYSVEHRLVVTRRPNPYTIAHEFCHAWQHQCILQAGRIADGSLGGWFLTPEGQSFLLMTEQGPSHNALEDAAGVCAYRVLGLSMEYLGDEERAWAGVWLR